jgi:glycosyltransferase involved in cell wall biosynthesis
MISISIVTASYNAATTINDCLSSIGSQTHPCEHIIIDGGSTDGTLDVVRKFPHVAHVVSEPDSGIYDAMNKGITLATGDIIGILNADDIYNGEDVLAKVAKVFECETLDSCFADLVYVAADDTNKIIRYWKAGDFLASRIFNGWIPPHPTFFVRRSVYEKYGAFNLEAGIAADYELMLRMLLKHSITTKHIPSILVRMRLGGVSNRSFKSRIDNAFSTRLGWQLNGLKPRPWTLAFRSLLKVRQYFTAGAVL